MQQPKEKFLQRQLQVGGTAPDADSKGVRFLVQAAMVQLHAAVVQVHTVDQLVVWPIFVFSLQHPGRPPLDIRPSVQITVRAFSDPHRHATCYVPFCIQTQDTGMP